MRNFLSFLEKYQIRMERLLAWKEISKKAIFRILIKRLRVSDSRQAEIDYPSDNDFTAR